MTREEELAKLTTAQLEETLRLRRREAEDINASIEQLRKVLACHPKSEHICSYCQESLAQRMVEAGWAVGAGKFVIVYVPALAEPDLMVKMAVYVTSDLMAVREVVKSFHLGRQMQHA